MRTLMFYGSSDDLFCMDSTNRKEDDEFYPSDCIAITAPDTFKYDDTYVGLIVTAEYSPARNACWAIGLSQLEEDQPLPDWTISFAVAPSGRSVALSIEVPDDAKIKVINRQD